MPRTAGAGIAALGLALLLAAGLLDAEPLYVPGIGLLALVAGAHAWVALAVPGAEVSRALATRRVEEGQPVEVVLELAVSGLPLPGGTLEDPLLPAGAPLPALRSEWGSEDPLALRRGRLRLSASFARRGRRRLAPPVLAIGDPLGLARRRVPGTGEVQEILVLPRLAPVESESGGGGGGLGTLAAGWAAAMEVDGLRPYREGAPASRIHWPAVARRGDLVERRLRAESEARPIVVLDARAPASEAALDAAVRAAASLAHALGRGSGCALALPGERRPSEIEPDLGSWPLAHARLALVEAGGMAPVPASGQSRRGAVVYVAARPLTRLPAAWAGIARGPRLLVLPDGLGGADAPVLRVAGCTGHALLARASAPRGGGGVSAVPLPRARPLAPPLAARLLGFGLLAGWGASRWARLVAPSAPAALAGMLALAAALGLLAARLRRARSALRALAGSAGALVLLGGVLLLAGVPAALVLDPRNWGDLGSGIGQGLQGLPNASTPYDGADAWVRAVTLAGGGLVLGLGAGALAELPARAGLAARAWVAAPLVLLAAVPAVVLSDRAGVAQGLGLFAALAAALWLERLPADAWRAAAALACAAGLVGLGAGSAIDAREPWIHYDRLVVHLAPQRAESFDWRHSYGPLDWVRTGREVLRVKMRRKVYLKAENLDAFDGVRWVPQEVQPGAGQLGELPAHPDPRWRERLEVTFRSLRSRLVVGAGTTEEVTRAPSRVVGTGSPGTFRSVEELRPASSYAVSVYAPAPKPAELAREPSASPGWLDAYRELRLPGPGGSVDVQFAALGQRLAPLILERDGRARRSAAQVAASRYGRTYALARRLAAGAATPYALVARVEAYLASPRFRYSERARSGGLPLQRFLLTDPRGYCQQFSGAMALLLRMGGVPARVSAGFTPGEHDEVRADWIVRDFDAHSWVEVWFPREGWVTFDPTPAAAPALAIGVLKLGPGDAPDLRTRRRATSGATAGRIRAGGGGVSPWAVAGLLAAGLLLVAALGCLVRRVRRARRQDAVAELVDALRLCGRAPPPTFTLQQLERRLRTSDDARGYVRALRLERYGFAGGARAERAGGRCAGSSRAASACRGGSARSGRSHPARPAAPKRKMESVDDVYDLYQRGMSLLESGDYHPALVPLRKARDLEPEKTSIREALGRAAFRAQSYEEARQEFAAVAERAPTNDFALFCLGRSLQMLGRHAEARHPLALASCLRPERRDYRAYRDRARRRAGGPA